jgi:molecular chaperone GrpE
VSQSNEEEMRNEAETSGASGDETEGEAGGPAVSPDEADRRALVEERDRLKDQLLRTAADFDNYRKRSRRDVEDAQRRAQEETIRELLPVVDNLERALQATDQATDTGAVAEGVRMVLRGFEEVAQRLGLSRIEAMGQRFDPSLHDAVQQVETDEHAPGTIVAEVVPGYNLRDKLLRPALVVVAKQATKPADA